MQGREEGDAKPVIGRRLQSTAHFANALHSELHSSRAGRIFCRVVRVNNMGRQRGAE